MLDNMANRPTFDDVLRAVQPPHPPRTPPPPLCVARPRRRTRSGDKENSTPTRAKQSAKLLPPSSPRICVLRAGAFTPHTPPRDTRSSGEQPKFRMRRIESAHKIACAFQATETGPAKPPTLLNSASAPTLARHDATPMVAVVSAKLMRQRARSAPVRRLPPPPKDGKPLGSCLGMSLHCSSGAMLRASALRPLGLPAARVFIDPATGKEAYLRPIGNGAASE